MEVLSKSKPSCQISYSYFPTPCLNLQDMGDFHNDDSVTETFYNNYLTWPWCSLENRHRYLHSNDNRKKYFAELREKWSDKDKDDKSEGSSYSSTGSIECSLSKKYLSSSSSSNDTDITDNTDALLTGLKIIPSTDFTDEDKREIQLITNGTFHKEGERLFPRSSLEYIETHSPFILHQILTDSIKEGWGFLNPSLLTVLGENPQLITPHRLLFDLCLFSSTKPVTILTFINSQETDIELRYNAEVAKQMNRLIKRKIQYTTRVIHGIVTPSEWESLQNTVDRIYTNAKERALPGSLDMNAKMFCDISEAFMKFWKTTNPENKNIALYECQADLITDQYLTPSSSLRAQSKDSGVYDVNEHTRLEEELETMSAASDDDIDIDGPAEISPVNTSSSNRVYRYVLSSMKGELADELDCSKFLDVLQKRNVISESEVTLILKQTSKREQNRMLLQMIKNNDNIPLFLEILEKFQRYQHLRSKLKKHYKILKQMTFLTDDSEFQHSEVSIVSLLKLPEKIAVSGRKQNLLNKIVFQLRLLLTNGDVETHDYYLSRLRKAHSADLDIMFHVFESESLKGRLFHADDFDQSHLLSHMEDLIPKLTQPVEGTVILFARKGSAVAMKGDLNHALDLLTAARNQMDLLQPCHITTLAMNTLVNVLMLVYEENANPLNKKKLISTIAETIECHVPNTMPDAREEFRRNFYLKMAFAYLGIGLFGNVIECQVTDDDIKAAKSCLRMTETCSGTFVCRRAMFYSLGQAVLYSKLKIGGVTLKCAEDAKRIADDCGFKKEMNSIQQWSQKLRASLTLTKPEDELVKALKDLDVMTR